MNKTRKAWIALLVVAAVIAISFAPFPVEDVTRIYTVVSIGKPNAAVFNYATTPANWPKWHPSSLHVSGATDHSLAVGEQVVEEYLVAGRHGHVTWTVVKRDASWRWVIEGEMEGRKVATITYTLTATAQGTLFERELTYRATPLWFSILNRLILRQRVEAESAEASQRLKLVLESAVGA